MSIEHKDEIIKASIIKAAENLFQKWGLNKTTMEDIAKASGKGKSTLYYYFKSKEEIFDVVLMKEMNEVQDAVRKAVAKETSFETKMRTYVITNLNEIRKRTNMYSIVKAEITMDDGFIKKLRSIFDTQELEDVKEIINFGIRNGEIKNFGAKEIATLAHIILISFRGIEIDLFIEHKFFDDNEKIDNLIDILYNGIKK